MHATHGRHDGPLAVANRRYRASRVRETVGHRAGALLQETVVR